jgi:hypothetical protein
VNGAGAVLAGGAGLSVTVPNICVKLPAEDGVAGGLAGAVSGPNPGGNPGAGASGFLSRATWTNALASSRDAFRVGGAMVPVGWPGVLSACSMRVKSPGGFAPAGGTAGSAASGGAGLEKLGAGGADESENAGAGGGGVGVENTGAGAGADAGAANGAGAALEKAGGAGEAGEDAGFSESVPNICVKLPGVDDGAGDAGAGDAGIGDEGA